MRVPGYVAWPIVLSSGYGVLYFAAGDQNSTHYHQFLDSNAVYVRCLRIHLEIRVEAAETRVRPGKSKPIPSLWA